MKPMYMYIIDKAELKVHHPFILTAKTFGRADFPAELGSSISRVHFEVQFSQYSYYISDLGSKNGTIANGVLLTHTPTKYSKDTLFKVGKVYIYISDYAMYSEVDLLSKLNFIKQPIIPVDRTSISLVDTTYHLHGL